MSWMEVRFGSGGGNGEVDLTVLRSENKQRKRTNWRLALGVANNAGNGEK